LSSRNPKRAAIDPARRTVSGVVSARLPSGMREAFASVMPRLTLATQPDAVADRPSSAFAVQRAACGMSSVVQPIEVSTLRPTWNGHTLRERMEAGYRMRENVLSVTAKPAARPEFVLASIPAMQAGGRGSSGVFDVTSGAAIAVLQCARSQSCNRSSEKGSEAERTSSCDLSEACPNPGQL
jgi:hypothetical protein